jgi:hypothetical protein
MEFAAEVNPDPPTKVKRDSLVFYSIISSLSPNETIVCS